MKKRIACTFLALLMLALTLASCASDDGGVSDTLSGASSDVSDTTAGETSVLDHLPDVNFDGRDFRVGVMTKMAYEIDVEEQDGEITNDAIYSRNTLIEERFGVNIKALPTSDEHKAISPFLINSVLAGDDTYDVFGLIVYRFYEAVTAEVLGNWADVSDLALDKPWWNQQINDNATINDKLYGLTGTLAISYLQNTNAILFNMPLAENYGYDKNKLYSSVDDGTWTIDYLAEAVKSMYSDLDGDNTASDGDLYGFTLPHYVSYDGWLTAFDIPITTTTSDGTIEAGFLNEKTVTALEKMNELLYNNQGSHYLKPSYDNYAYFVNEQYVFYVSYLLECFDNLRAMESAYGVLPMPKWDEAQEDYHCLVADGYTMWGLPKTVTDYEFVGVITEALCAETYNSVYPVYYDVALKNKYSEDADTARMMDIIVQGGDFDISFSFGVYLDYMPYMFRQLLQENRTDLMSYYAAKESAIVEKLDKLYSYYED